MDNKFFYPKLYYSVLYYRLLVPYYIYQPLYQFDIGNIVDVSILCMDITKLHFVIICVFNFTFHNFKMN